MSNATNQHWQKLNRLADGDIPTPDLLSGEVRQLAVAGLQLDYTKARIDANITGALGQLADASDIAARFAAMFAGDEINFTEQRAVLHTQLRDPTPPPEVAAELERMLAFADRVTTGSFKLTSGKAVKSIVHIGIGGSFLGPKLYHEALPATIECRFVANIDPAALVDALVGLDPAATLIVCASKSGTTSETLANTAAALAWLATSTEVTAPTSHLVAVSTKAQMATDLGCPPEQSFAMWDWVGGRYSVWSPVSISVAAANGAQAFREFLAGGHEIDAHVQSTHGFANMAVTLALLNLWHGLACDAHTHCVVAYQHRLRSLPMYLQQLVMESNGKSTTQAGTAPTGTTAGIWWGGEGTNDQHSYYQLLLQGMRKVSCDFIFALEAQPGEDTQMQRSLLANVLGQSRALMLGRDLAASITQLQADGIAADRVTELAPHLIVPGGQPSNLLYFQRLTPRVLGALVALYEHMTAVQGWLWQINSFDQWGVELGKINFRKVQAALESGDCTGLDVSTTAIIRQLSG